MKEILITSSVLILAVVGLRLLFQKKVSRRLIYCAWLLVALRLLVPVQFGNVNFSILTPAQPVTDAIGQVAQTPVAGPSREEVYNNALQDYIAQERPIFVPEVQEQVDTRSSNPAARLRRSMKNCWDPKSRTTSSCRK